MNDVFGPSVPPESFRAAKARHLVAELAADRVPCTELVECKQDGWSDTVVMRVQTGVGQISKRDIRPAEKIAVKFRLADDGWPGVFALRHDFPNDLSLVFVPVFINELLSGKIAKCDPLLRELIHNLTINLRDMGRRHVANKAATARKG